MDSSSGEFKVGKLVVSTYQIWKQKIQLILAFREPDDHIEETVPPSDHFELEV